MTATLNSTTPNRTLLGNRRILLGVTGGIAAYKAAELVRRLRDASAEVRVVMTPAAHEFITPMTLQALSGHPVHSDLFDPAQEAAMGHIDLARWADLVLIAPASADFLARLRGGMANDLLSTLCLATRAPIVLAPAMNQVMWLDPRTQENVESLKVQGVTLLGPAHGIQACGENGPGRLLEPDLIVTAITSRFQSGTLAGKKVVITAGPTREAIDPVRFITNHSSGKMGFALARAAAEAGATVTLVAGPVTLPTPDHVARIDVTSALEMFDATLREAATADIVISSAAVADYRPAETATQKIKKSGETHQLALVRNPDIIAAVGKLSPKPFLVGFAAETEKLEEHARGKLEAKNLDMIVANDVSAPGIGFHSDNNAVTVLEKNSTVSIPECSKALLAQQLIEMIAHRQPPSCRADAHVQ